MAAIHNVCHFSVKHSSDDIRVRVRECGSIAAAGYRTKLIVTKGHICVSDDGVEVVDLGKRGSTPVAVIRTHVRLLAELRRQNADVYHFHDPELLMIGYMLRRDGRKVIYDAHENSGEQILSKHYLPQYARRPLSAITTFVEHRLAPRMSAVIGATPNITDRFKSLGVKTVNINNYPITNEILEDQAWSSRKNQVCYIGSITEERGIVELIQGIGQARVPLVLVGRFANQDLQRRVESLAGWAFVDFRGQVPREQARQILYDSKVGAVTFLPTAHHLTCQPAKLYEYMGGGVAVLGSNIPHWEPIIVGRVAGVCVDPKDPVSIGKAITQLLTYDEQAQVMGQNGMAAAHDVYNWQQEERKLLHLYEELT